MKKRLPLRSMQILVLNVAFLFVFTGCATKQVKYTETGFLSSYADLEEDEGIKGVRIYTNPEVDIVKQYTKILIKPVQFELDPEFKEQKIDEEQKKELAEFFYNELKEKLGENFEITETPGKDVLILRSAITGILPNKVYLNLHWSTTLMGAGIGGGSLEAELIDSLTNERMVSLVAARKGRRLNYTKGLTKWGHTKEVLGIWANIISEHLDKLKGQDEEEN